MDPVPDEPTKTEPRKRWTHGMCVYTPARVLYDGDGRFRGILADFETAEIVVNALRDSGR